MRTRAKMCPDLAIGVLRALFENASVRQGRFGAKFVKRQLFFDTQVFLFRIQKVILAYMPLFDKGSTSVFVNQSVRMYFRSQCFLALFR